MSWRLVAAVAVLVLVVVYALGSGRWVATSGDWYQSLQQPSWQPPSWVFGLAWTYNFAAIAIVGVAYCWAASGSGVVAFVAHLALTVALAIGWAYLFYGPHALTFAAACLTAAALLTAPILVLGFVQQPWLGWVLVPYQVWLVLATGLSWAYAARSAS